MLCCQSYSTHFAEYFHHFLFHFISQHFRKSPNRTDLLRRHSELPLLGQALEGLRVLASQCELRAILADEFGLTYHELEEGLQVLWGREVEDYCGSDESLFGYGLAVLFIDDIGSLDELAQSSGYVALGRLITSLLPFFPSAFHILEAINGLLLFGGFLQFSPSRSHETPKILRYFEELKEVDEKVISLRTKSMQTTVTQTKLLLSLQ